MNRFGKTHTKSDRLIDVLLLGDVCPKAAPTFLPNGTLFPFSFNRLKAGSENSFGDN